MATIYLRVYLKPDTVSVLEQAEKVYLEADSTRKRENCIKEKTIHAALRYYIEN